MVSSIDLQKREAEIYFLHIGKNAIVLLEFNLYNKLDIYNIHNCLFFNWICFLRFYTRNYFIIVTIMTFSKANHNKHKPVLNYGFKISTEGTFLSQILLESISFFQLSRLISIKSYCFK